MAPMPADERANALVVRHATVLDPALRVSALRAELAGLPAADVADLVEVIAEAADAGLPTHRDLLLVLVAGLADPTMAEAKARAGDSARERGLSVALGLLVPEAPKEPPGESSAAPERTTGDRPRTLGERKSLARGRDRVVLERALRDPHPDVARILLGNPALTERDVVRLAARRPGRAGVLREIVLSTRWMVRYAVRLALLQNPALPTDLGLALVRQLTRKDAHAVAHAEDLPESVRELALRESRRGPLH